MIGARVTLLGPSGEPRPEVAADSLLHETSVEFVSCAALTGVRIELAAAIEVRWLRLHFLGCAEHEAWHSWLRSPRPPPLASLTLALDGDETPTKERRFATTFNLGTAQTDAILCELACLPARTSSVLLRFASGPWALARIEFAEQPFVGVRSGAPIAPRLSTYPLPRHRLPKSGDELAAALYALRSEPTIEDVWKLALPYRGGALLGNPGGPLAYQLWDGGLVLRPKNAAELLDLSKGARVLLRIEFADHTISAHTQRLRRGYLPMGEVQLSAGNLQLGEATFVDSLGGLRLSIALAQKKGTHGAASATLRASATRRLSAKNDPRLQVEVETPLGLRLDGEELRFEAAPPSVLKWPVPKDATVERVLRIELFGASAESPAPLPDALAAAEAELQTFLNHGAKLDLPDARLANLWRALLIQHRLFVRGEVMRYGLFPGLYEDGLFGIEEGWNVVALAQFGHGALATDALERTFFAKEFLIKEGPHHQYRNGLSITYALDVYHLTGDRTLLERLWPTVRESALWIAAGFASTRVRQAGERPPHYGLMPKHIYGGDLREPAYSLYASSACWRGLRDAARIAGLVEEPTSAATFSEAAAIVRSDIVISAERIYRQNGKPPFLPFRTDEKADAPSSGDYYQLFASLVLETAVFGWNGRFARALTEYLEATGRMVLGVPRFDGWFGRLGVDAEYARGVQLAAMHRRNFGRFWLGMLGQIGLSCDPHTFVSPETAVVNFTDGEYQDRLRVLSRQAARADSDPCSSGSAMMLQYLRYLLAFEERNEDDLPTGRLWLAPVAPSSWFQPGQSFGVQQLPTVFGWLTYHCSSDLRWVTYEVNSNNRLEIEAFYFDAAGKRRSGRTTVEGPARLAFPR